MEKILVVDDDDALRGMIKMRLSDTYETIDTGNPVQALELALQHKPRAILLDLMMPDCSGFELCQSFHNLSYTSRIPIFIVSGESAAKYREYMNSLGARGYFEKPIDFAKLKSTLAAELQGGTSERRACVRVRMKVILKLKGTDSSQRSFEQLTTTENVSAGGFLCVLGSPWHPTRHARSSFRRPATTVTLATCALYAKKHRTRLGSATLFNSPSGRRNGSCRTRVLGHPQRLLHQQPTRKLADPSLHALRWQPHIRSVRLS